MIDVQTRVALETNPAIDIWTLDARTIDLPDIVINDVLTESERERSARMRVAAQARLWRLVRAALRLRLADCLDRPARELEFELGEFGKPDCAGVAFNVSHSGDIGVIAVGTRLNVPMNIGVDIEQHDDRRDIPELARTVCTEDEVQALSTLQDTELTQAFTRAWTRKESWLKARGVGLGFGATRIHVGVGATPDPPRVDDVLDCDATLVDLSAPTGYAMALCWTTAPLDH